MKNPGVLLGIMLVSTLASCTTVQRDAVSTDEQEIRAMYDRYSDAVTTRNLDAIMAFYVPDQTLVAFDAYPPRQYVGAAAYRKSYEAFFAEYPGPVTSEISDLRITTEGNLGFTSSIDRWIVTDSEGKTTELVFRTTNGLRKVAGRWLIAHEHISFPVDAVTGQGDFLSKP